MNASWKRGVRSIAQVRAICCLFPAMTLAQSGVSGIPEPGLVMYGTVTNANGSMPILQGNVQRTLPGGGSASGVNSLIAVVH